MKRILPLPKYRVIVQGQHHSHRGYTYVIVRTDLPEWAECSTTLYATVESASEAGWMALEQFIDRAARGPRLGKVPRLPHPPDARAEIQPAAHAGDTLGQTAVLAQTSKN